MSGGVSYCQMTVPERDNGARLVREQLDRRVDVHIDREHAGPWSSARRAWAATPPDCAWRVLLQDDIELAPSFAVTIEYFLIRYARQIAQRPIMFYNGLRDEPAAGEHWIERRDGVQGPVIAMPGKSVPHMLEWCDRYIRPDTTVRSSDIRPSLWLESFGMTALCPSPSWVQHKGNEPSVNGTKSTKSQPRTSPSYTGRPLGQYDWRRGLARPGAVVGHPLGASSRVRFDLWRTWHDRPDHELARLGLDPRIPAEWQNRSPA